MVCVVSLLPGAATTAAGRVLLSATVSFSSSASSSLTRCDGPSFYSSSARLVSRLDGPVASYRRRPALRLDGHQQRYPKKELPRFLQEFSTPAPAASSRRSTSVSCGAAVGLSAAAPGALSHLRLRDGSVSLPCSWCRDSLPLPSASGYLLQPSHRWTHTGRRINSTSSSSSEDGSCRWKLPVWSAVATAEGGASDYSGKYYVVLTALLSSAALLTVDRESRRQRFPAACGATAAGAAVQWVQHGDKFSPRAAAAFDSSSFRSGVQDRPQSSTRITASSPCGYVGNSSSSISGASSRWNRRHDKSGDRRESRRSCGMYCSRMPHAFSAAAWRGEERFVARCAAAEQRVSWLPPPADCSEISELSAATESRGKEGVADAMTELRTEKKNTSMAPSSLRASAVPKELQSGSVCGSTAGTSSAVENGAVRRTKDDEAGGQTAASEGRPRQSPPAGEEARQHHHHDSPLWRSEENRPFERKLEDALLFCGNSNQPLATAVADRLSTKLGKVAVKRFADGEVNIQFLDSLRGKDVYLIQPTSSPVNEHLMELLLMISTCRRASAKKITAVIPYYGYARQDRKLSSRVPISAADVARMIEAMGVDRVVAVDLHCGQIQGFFGPRVPVDNLEAQITGLEYFQHKNLQKPVVVSPDAGGVYRARKFQEGLLARGYRDCGIAMLIKQRVRANEIERMDLVGSVEGSDVIIVDDMIDTAGTLCEAARELRAKGARRVFAFATHGLFSGPAINRIESSPLEEVVVTDSIQARREVLDCPRITSLSISVLLADAIRRIHQKESLNDLFVVKSWQ